MLVEALGAAEVVVLEEELAVGVVLEEELAAEVVLVEGLGVVQVVVLEEELVAVLVEELVVDINSQLQLYATLSCKVV